MKKDLNKNWSCLSPSCHPVGSISELVYCTEMLLVNVSGTLLSAEALNCAPLLLALFSDVLN